MAAREWASLAAGLALAGLGLGAFATASPPGGAAPAATTQPAATSSETVPGSASGAVTPAASSADGAGGTVLGTLLAGGYLEVIVPGEAGIPAEVARVLATRGVALQVPAESVAPPVPGGAR